MKIRVSVPSFSDIGPQAIAEGLGFVSIDVEDGAYILFVRKGKPSPSMQEIESLLNEHALKLTNAPFSEDSPTTVNAIITATNAAMVGKYGQDVMTYESAYERWKIALQLAASATITNHETGLNDGPRKVLLPEVA